MEDTHRGIVSATGEVVKVLILVLMEDTHRVMSTTTKESVNGGLNPCSNGRYSQSQ